MTSDVLATEHEELAATVWDFYKEVHGIRPRWMNANSMSVEDLRNQIAQLEVEWEERAEQRAAEEAYLEFRDMEYNMYMEDAAEEEKYQYIGRYDEYDPRYHGAVTADLPRKW